MMMSLALGLAMINEPQNDVATNVAKGFAKIPKSHKATLNKFGQANLAKLAKEANGRNIMISAWSLQECFGMVRLGAKGKTNSELATYLGQPEKPIEAGQALNTIRAVLSPLMKTDQIRQANGLWVSKGSKLEPSFMANTQKYFQAGAHEAIFPHPGLEQVNGFVKTTTRGKIPKLFNDIPSGARLVLVNAISFMDKWQLPFDHNATHNEDFHVSSKVSKQVPMMQRKMFVSYAEDKNCQAVKLPYKSGLEMTIWLPKAGVSLEKVITGSDSLVFAQSQVAVTLPKWKSEFTWDLKTWMQKNGVETCFMPTADFTGIAKGLFIGEALQKTFIKVDEDGTEAAAATGIMMPTSAMPGRTPEFRADHPFAYAIGAPNGVTLFTGFVNNPSV